MNDTRPTKNLFTVRPAQDRILWAVFFFCLLPLMISSFFNFMSGDDYTLHAYYSRYGFWATQRMVYTQWTGRFTSTFLGTLFMKLGLPDRYYFMHTLLLLAFTWGAIFFLLSTINRNWLADLFTRSRLALAGSILLITTIYVQAEIATGFYWFSAAVTYQTAFIFFLLLGGCLIRRFYSSGTRRQRQYDGLIGLLILLISGCNEVAAVFLAFFLLTLIVAAYFFSRPALSDQGRRVPAALIAYLGLSLLTGMIILFTSGILSVRSQFMNSNTSIATIIPMIFFRTATVFYYILKVPLFWIAGALLHMTGRRVAEHPAIVPSLAPWKDRKVLLPGLVAVTVLIFLTLTAVLMVSKGSLPDRALNNLTDLGAFCLLTIFFIAGVVNAVCSQPRPSVMLPPAAFVMILVAGLFASDPFAEAWKSSFSGYFYHAVQEDRRQKMETAQKNHQTTVNLQPYEEALSQKIHEVFPHGVFATVNTLLRERPALFFRENGPDTPDHGWLNYYGLDSVTVGRPPDPAGSKPH